MLGKRTFLGALCLGVVAILWNHLDFTTDKEKLQFLQNVFAEAEIQVVYDPACANLNTTTIDCMMCIRDLAAFDRIVRDGSLGLSESYMEGQWDTNDLRLFYDYIQKHRTKLESHIKASYRLLWIGIRAKIFNLNSLITSMDVIREHYDLGNELYVATLGTRTMQYTGAYYRNGDESLDEAQLNKMHLLSLKLDLPAKGEEPMLTVMDIGCGWGALAHYLATNYNVKVVGITLSKEQKKYADENFSHPNVEIRLEDYRHVTDKFDRIVTVGMIEHVGQKNYDIFFESVNKALKEDGLYVLHTIGRQQDLYAPGGKQPFIEKYIFPGICIPCMGDMIRSSNPYFILEDFQNIGPSYAKTLRDWWKLYEENRHTLPERFQTPFFHRLWIIYLNQCESAFKYRYLNLWQFVFHKQGVLHPQANHARRFTPHF